MNIKLKKMVAFLATTALTVSVGIPAFAADGVKDASNNAAYTERSVQRSISYEVTTNGVRLRATPSLSGGIIANLQKGDIVVDLKNSVYADGYTWMCVQCVNCADSSLNGTPAWVASIYLREI